MKSHDYVIVGSGLFGSVCAQQLTDAGFSCLMLECRPQIGGNCFTRTHEETGAIVHQYGTHIFHTDNARIWRYVNRFSEFTGYRHRVLTTHNGRVFSMPINLSTINAFFGTSLTPAQVEPFLASRIKSIPNPSNLEEKAIALVGEELYGAFIREYTLKQWGTDPRLLPARIITRLPVRMSYDDSYFSDQYQGVPLEGYTPMFERMLVNVTVLLSVDFFENVGYWQSVAKRGVIYTGPIDTYFGFAEGRLGWRSVDLVEEVADVADYQGTAVMNYADASVPWTRIHEPHHLHPERTHSAHKTLIVREYPSIDASKPYYPIGMAEDQRVYEAYAKLAAADSRTLFGGRLAEYRYYDMHQVIGSALAKVKAFASQH